jgi:membrane protein implicated in regulation of membrane protease activity
MSYLIWSSIALLSAGGALVSTGHANTEVAAIMAFVALVALAASCIWHLSRRRAP